MSDAHPLYDSNALLRVVSPSKSSSNHVDILVSKEKILDS